MDKKYANWSERRNLLIKLQGQLLQYFPKEDYNVIIFGSYIRADFDVRKSDIDIIVYAEDEKKQEKVGGFVKKFFQKEEISSDVLLYSFNPFSPPLASATLTFDLEKFWAKLGSLPST